MDKMRMESVDMTVENIEKIGEMFPNCITETKGENGKPKKVINFELLKQMLSSDVLEGDEAYEFTWVGKKAAIVEANKPIRKSLRPCPGESKDWNTTKNLYIEGDNLEVLKLLQENYLGRIKMIYIDPPYNTGNDFIYKDDFKMSTEEYEDELCVTDDDGNRMIRNADSNGRFHSDWCSMLYSRLMLARNLLKENGVIFISIDDGEVGNLRKMCDEVYGEDNFVANLIWQKKFSRSNDATYFSTMHDHILCYCKQNILTNPNGWEIGLLPREDEVPSGYSNPDNDPRGVWTSVILSAKSGSNNLLYEITTPSGRKVTPPSGRFWSCNKETFKKWLGEKRIWFGANGDGSPRKKTFLSEVQSGLRPNTILFHEDAGHNQEAKQETKALFDGLGLFDGPKPVRLLEILLTIANLDSDDIVLDFFSGSATTAHSVMKFDADKKSNIKYILVQLPEETSCDSEAYKAGYKTICEIGKERIRRAGYKIKVETGADIDYGFRVFKVDESNMKDVYYTPEELGQQNLDSLTSNIKEGRTDLDLLFGCVLDWGLPLSLPYTSEKIGEFTVHTYNDGDLIACFDENISEDVIKTIAKRHPLRVVFRDSSFANSPAKINVEEIFRLLSPDTSVKVI